MSRLVAPAAALGLASSAVAFPVIFDNIDPNGGPLFTSGDLQASQRDMGFGFDAGCADDFVLPASPDESGDWQVTDVQWLGRFVTGSPVEIDSFNIIFWPDAGGLPAGSNSAGLPPKYNEALAIYSGVPAVSSPGGGGATSFQYIAELPAPFTAADGVPYWIEVQANVNYPPLWAFEVTLMSQFARPHYGFDLFSTPFWTELGNARDNAFILSGVPVPEPGGAMLLGFGALVLARSRRRSVFF
jgi:hypothetical protein